MTQPQTDTLTPYAPLPVRARGTLEIFDTAFKLFRRYAGVLLAWSALSCMVNLVPFLGLLVYIFTMPLMFGAVSCVVAGAVRGQNVGFKQIWGFTKPRYGALLGVLILAVILMGIVALGLLIVVLLSVAFIASAAINFGWFAMGVAWIVGILVGLIGSSFLLAVLMGWFNLAPVIACLEDNNRGSNAVSRAWALLKGNWRKACGVATILFLAGMAVCFILIGFAVLFFGGGWDKFVGLDISSVSALAIWGFITLFFLGWTPLQAVVGAVFYLDLRTRKEALDLEWTNYAAKPETLPGQEPTASPPAFSPTPPTPTNGPAYATSSSLPVMSSSPAGSSFSSPPSPPSQANLPPQTTPTIFVAQSPAQSPNAEVVPAVTPAPLVPAVAASPLAPEAELFASQGETTPQNIEAPAPLLTTPLETAPTPTIMAAAIAEAAPSAIVEPAVAVQPPVPLEIASVAPSIESSVTVTEPPVASIPFEPVPVPVAAPTEPAIVSPLPPALVPTPEPEATSSFAPRRFRRAASEDDDYPSSFGGGTR